MICGLAIFLIDHHMFVFRRKFCTSGSGFPPIYVNVHMKTGEILNNWIDALQAAWAGLQVSTLCGWGYRSVHCVGGAKNKNKNKNKNEFITITETMMEIIHY